VFGENGSEISVNWAGGNPGALMFLTLGPGYRGIVVCEQVNDARIPSKFGVQLTPWGKGIFFYCQ